MGNLSTNYGYFNQTWQWNVHHLLRRFYQRTKPPLSSWISNCFVRKHRRVHIFFVDTPCFIELDDGKIYRKTPYLMVKTMVSCRFSLKPIHWVFGQIPKNTDPARLAQLTDPFCDVTWLRNLNARLHGLDVEEVALMLNTTYPLVMSK